MDEGLSWLTVPFSKQVTRATWHVLTEPGYHTLVLYAYAFDFSASLWRGLMIDLEPLFSVASDAATTCNLIDDYYEWTPGIDEYGATPHCILGKTSVYKRRKSCNKCINDLQYTVVVSLDHNCDCFSQDFLWSVRVWWFFFSCFFLCVSLF